MERIIGEKGRSRIGEGKWNDVNVKEKTDNLTNLFEGSKRGTERRAEKRKNSPILGSDRGDTRKESESNGERRGGRIRQTHEIIQKKQRKRQERRSHKNH